MAFQIAQAVYWLTRLVQGATNSVSAFLRVCPKILNAFHSSITEILVNEVGVKCPKSWYGQDKVEQVAGVRRFVIEHQQNVDNIPAEMERAGARISREKSDWCWNGVKTVRFVSGEEGRWLQALMVKKECNWPWCENHTKRRGLLGPCTYYRIWIPNYAIVERPQYQILLKDFAF